MKYEITVGIRNSIKRSPQGIPVTQNFPFKSTAYANGSHFHSRTVSDIFMTTRNHSDATMQKAALLDGHAALFEAAT
ncbi:hypothetical protein [Burkholderia sp. SIMBA_062]|uniref:hypothetical protein n=1 Tax=Burkholderia sp. SIMBA_062 TaxID=3085803 RepID=UPI00397D3F0C